MITCYKSTQAKIIILLGLITILISIFKYNNLKLVVAQSITFYLLAYQNECLIYGNCNISAWFNMLLPVLTTLIFVLDYLDYFKAIKIKAEYIYDKLKIINNSNFTKIMENKFIEKIIENKQSNNYLNKSNTT